MANGKKIQSAHISQQYLGHASLFQYSNAYTATCHIHRVIAYKKYWKYYIGR